MARSETSIPAKTRVEYTLPSAEVFTLFGVPQNERNNEWRLVFVGGQAKLVAVIISRP